MEPLTQLGQIECIGSQVKPFNIDVVVERVKRGTTAMQHQLFQLAGHTANMTMDCLVQQPIWTGGYHHGSLASIHSHYFAPYYFPRKRSSFSCSYFSGIFHVWLVFTQWIQSIDRTERKGRVIDSVQKCKAKLNCKNNSFML